LRPPGQYTVSVAPGGSWYFSVRSQPSLRWQGLLLTYSVISLGAPGRRIIAATWQLGASLDGLSG
jgi:hypothetical protein